MNYGQYEGRPSLESWSQDLALFTRRAEKAIGASESIAEALEMYRYQQKLEEARKLEEAKRRRSQRKTKRQTSFPEKHRSDESSTGQEIAFNNEAGVATNDDIYTLKSGFKFRIDVEMIHEESQHEESPAINAPAADPEIDGMISRPPPSHDDSKTTQAHLQGINLTQFLQTAKLTQYESALEDLGIEEFEDLLAVEEELLESSVGMRKVEIKRLHRKLASKVAEVQEALTDRDDILTTAEECSAR
uniref:non-specific protein-tyrosine kinase n=1 Tax=Octactis speculum TaxID=3111310 RepID=A0A7S2H0E7_9STRA